MKGVTKDGTERNHFGNLKASAPLLHRLREKDPAWWRLLKSQRDCYIDIRKDNTVNVYHNGGSMFRIGYDRGRYTAKTHANYLGLQRRSYADFSTDDLSQEVLDRIKAGIRQRTFRKRDQSPAGPWPGVTLHRHRVRLHSPESLLQKPEGQVRHPAYRPDTAERPARYRVRRTQTHRR